MNFDVAIVGGGLAGLAFAAGLRGTRLRIALIEGRPPVPVAGWDTRIYAISPANARFLDELGIWDRLDAGRRVPVRQMEIHGDAGGRLDFSAYDAAVGELAWICESSPLQLALWESLQQQDNVTLMCPGRPQALEIGSDVAALTLADGRTLAARLVVAADGAESWTRKAAGIEVDFKSYEQLGVVANFTCTKPHRDTAFQWFRDDGVLACLPLPGQQISMVWSTPTQIGRELLGLDAGALCQRVAKATDHRLGELNLLNAPAGFPLRLMRAPHSVDHRLALIGDAAHVIHPLSGHGINLGFQDARGLAQVLATPAAAADCGQRALLRRYERARKEEVVALQFATDSLQRLFSRSELPLCVLRNLGLNLTNHLPHLRDALVRYAMG
jgi:ubiquinone biosynthesis UbiH/UbiF/VisC/COQ6 family hydroxylase